MKKTQVVGWLGHQATKAEKVVGLASKVVGLTP
jgi:hypothetical protein